MPAAQTLQRHTAIVKCLRMFRPARKRTVAPTIALQTAFASSSRPARQSSVASCRASDRVRRHVRHRLRGLALTTHSIVRIG